MMSVLVSVLWGMKINDRTFLLGLIFELKRGFEFEEALCGEPDVAMLSTSHVEKQNHTLRMHCRRPTRLPNALKYKTSTLRFP